MTYQEENLKYLEERFKKNWLGKEDYEDMTAKLKGSDPEAIEETERFIRATQYLEDQGKNSPAEPYVFKFDNLSDRYNAKTEICAKFGEICTIPEEPKNPPGVPPPIIERMLPSYILKVAANQEDKWDYFSEINDICQKYRAR